MQINSGFTYFFEKPYGFGGALALKVLLFIFFSWQLWQHEGSFFWTFDDTRSYLTPIEHLLDGKGYSRDGLAAYGEAEFVPFAGRIPGLLPVYGPLYALLGAQVARLALVILQFVCSTLAGIILFWVARRLFSRLDIAYALLWIYMGSYHLHIFDHGGATESFAISASVFSLAAWLKFRETGKASWLWGAGALFAWTVCLRPIFGSYGFVWLLLLGGWEEKGLRQIRFFLPLALVLLIWNIRNVTVMGRVILLEDKWSISYPHEPEYGPDGLAIRKLIKAWGGDILFWNEGSMGNILLSPTPSQSIETGIPQRVYCEAYNPDSLKLLREGFFLANDLSFPDSTRQYWQAKTEKRARDYLHAYQNRYPLQAYVLNRFRLFYSFLLLPHPPEFPFPVKAELNSLQWAVKGFYTVFPYLITLIGLVSLLAALLWGKGILRVLPLFPTSMILVLVGVLGMIESRYALPLWPFFLIYGGWLAVKLQDLYRGKT